MIKKGVYYFIFKKRGWGLNTTEGRKKYPHYIMNGDKLFFHNSIVYNVFTKVK
jgi:hypothetical protein